MKKLLASLVLGACALGLGGVPIAVRAGHGGAAASAAAPRRPLRRRRGGRLAAPPPRRRRCGHRAAADACRGAAAAAPVANKGDVAWMIVATLLVIMMTMPGLALFYGGLVRSKNMLSVLMQVMVTFSLIVVLWCVYGYSLAFTEGNAFIGGFDRLFMKGVFDPATGTFAHGAPPSARASTSPSCCSPPSRPPSPASPAA